MNKILLEHSQIHSFMYYPWLLSLYKSGVVTENIWPTKTNLLSGSLKKSLPSSVVTTLYYFKCIHLRHAPKLYFGEQNSCLLIKKKFFYI